MALCCILDEADCDIHFYRASSAKNAYIPTPQGGTIELPWFGAKFYIPYQNRIAPAEPELIAAIGDIGENAS